MTRMQNRVFPIYVAELFVKSIFVHPCVLLHYQIGKIEFSMSSRFFLTNIYATPYKFAYIPETRTDHCVFLGNAAKVLRIITVPYDNTKFK